MLEEKIPGEDKMPTMGKLWLLWLLIMNLEILNLSIIKNVKNILILLILLVKEIIDLSIFYTKIMNKGSNFNNILCQILFTLTGLVLIGLYSIL